MTKILRIEYSRYTLDAKYHPNSRTNALKKHGVLLKFLFKDIGFGYADCHPLEEFGDASIDLQISLLKEKKFSLLTQRSAYFAKLDASFRNQKISAFNSTLHQAIPKNHYTSPALVRREDILECKKNGFSKFKFKFGKYIPNELNYLKDNEKFFLENNIRIRIDYNGNLQNEDVLTTLEQYKNIIEFIEDPYLEINEHSHLLLAKHKHNLNFAMDFINPDSIKTSKYDDVFNYKIIKPARTNYSKIKSASKEKKVIFTSSMDHPLGQICALYDACLYGINEDCGLITHHIFEPNGYSEQLTVKNACLLPTEGTGFGFDHLLKAEKWEKCF